MDSGREVIVRKVGGLSKWRAGGCMKALLFLPIGKGEGVKEVVLGIAALLRLLEVYGELGPNWGYWIYLIDGTSDRGLIRLT